MATSSAQTTAAVPGLLQEALAPRRERGLWSDAWRRLMKNRLAMFGLFALILIAFVAFAGPHLPVLGRYGPNDQNYDPAMKQLGPTGSHWFGTDQLGRDMWARTLEGLRISLQIGGHAGDCA
jgi:ABC-type dipeptide/oligopeptide/nickel transport system permease subunit